MFPKIGSFPPNTQVLLGFSMIFTIHFGVFPYFWKHPNICFPLVLGTCPISPIASQVRQHLWVDLGGFGGIWCDRSLEGSCWLGSLIPTLLHLESFRLKCDFLLICWPNMETTRFSWSLLGAFRIGFSRWHAENCCIHSSRFSWQPVSNKDCKTVLAESLPKKMPIVRILTKVGSWKDWGWKPTSNILLWFCWCKKSG